MKFTPPLPDKKYDIIYADPPWQYDQKLNKGQYAGDKASYHYQTMDTDSICRIPVKEIRDENSLLFLWVSSPHLLDGIKVGEAWGFKYITVGFVWDKQMVVTGHYTMTQCEMCLIFRNGSIPKPLGKRNIRQLLSVKRGKHSQKPTEVRERITEMFPTQAKIELFARPNIFDYDRGWDFWGNEVNQEATL